MKDIKRWPLSGAKSTKQRLTANWHSIDEDNPLDGFDDIPDARQGETQTPVLWVKFRCMQLSQVVVSRGRYDYDGGVWTARLSSVEDGDRVASVVALGWATMVVGEKPWDGPTIRKHDADPW
jgi:hypothetical protein